MTIKEINITPPDPDVVEFIEGLLEKAKRGEIQSIAVVISAGSYETGNAWEGMGKNNMAVIGEIESLKVDLMRFFVEQRVQEDQL